MHHARRGCRPMAGYTLIELLVVITTLGILMGLAYLRLGPALTHAKVRGAANVIATDLQHAQVLAARLRQPIVFTVDVPAKYYILRDRPSDTTYVSRRLGPGSDWSVTELSASPVTIEFFPSGITSADAVFTVGTTGYGRRVTISRAGQIRIQNAP